VVRVTVDHARCQGAGLCALTVPDVFDQREDDGTVLLLDPSPPEELHDAVRRAVDLCPNAVVRVAD
jgi:ferredoxin